MMYLDSVERVDNRLVVRSGHRVQYLYASSIHRKKISRGIAELYIRNVDPESVLYRLHKSK